MSIYCVISSWHDAWESWSSVKVSTAACSMANSKVEDSSSKEAHTEGLYPDVQLSTARLKGSFRHQISPLISVHTMCVPAAYRYIYILYRAFILHMSTMLAMLLHGGNIYSHFRPLQLCHHKRPQAAAHYKSSYSHTPEQLWRIQAENARTVNRLLAINHRKVEWVDKLSTKVGGVAPPCVSCHYSPSCRTSA